MSNLGRLVDFVTFVCFAELGRMDILTVALENKVHPSRVRGVGNGVGIRYYFGLHLVLKDMHHA